MAGKIPPQFLKNVKGATSKGGPQSGDDTKKNSKLPPWLQKKGSADQQESDSKNPFAEVTKGKGKPGKKMSAAQKKALLAKARKEAVAKKFGGKSDAKANPFADMKSKD